MFDNGNLHNSRCCIVMQYSRRLCNAAIISCDSVPKKIAVLYLQDKSYVEKKEYRTYPTAFSTCFSCRNANQRHWRALFLSHTALTKHSTQHHRTESRAATETALPVHRHCPSQCIVAGSSLSFFLAALDMPVGKKCRCPNKQKSTFNK